ncbi:MAG: hypothetical protein ACO376_07995 [Gammaproteobacteria bacterium]
MHAATSNTLGSQIAAAIGMPTHNLVSFTLRFHAGEMVRCDAEYLVDGYAATGITQLIGKSYTVMERTDAKPAHNTTQHCASGA